MDTYRPDNNRIIHKTKVDFNTRQSVFTPVYLVQYDDKLPILEVTVYNEGSLYYIPTNATATIRLGKKGGKFVANNALGCDTNKNKMYFEVTRQMVTDPGKTFPIIEMKINGNVAGSSPICVIVERNPVQDSDVESTTEYKELVDYANEAKQSASEAAASKNAAASSASQSEASRQKAASEASAAEASKNAAAESQLEASRSASAAEASKNAAAASETRSAASAEASAESETKAKDHENTAKEWADWANSYARGEGNKRENETVDNAKYYYEQTLKLQQSKNGIIPMGSITFEELAMADKQVGYMYNVTNAFITDDTFSVGAGKYFGPGNNILWTPKEEWDVMAASTVSGIKGNAEDTYQQGDYEITPDKIKLKDDFSTAIERAKLAPGDSLSTAFSKLAKYCETIESNEKKTPVFGKYEEFPIPGDTGRLYVDDTVDPRLIFTWDEAQQAYVLTGGAGGEGSSMDIPVTLLRTAWEGEKAPYTQTVTVPQMREGLTPIHFLDPNSTDEEIYAYSLLVDYRANLGSITFYAADAPLIDIHLILKGVPAQELDYPNNNLIVLVDHTGFTLNGETNTYDKTIDVEGMQAGIGGYWDIVRDSGVITRQESEIALNIIDVVRLKDAIKISCMKEPTADFKLIIFETYKNQTEGDTLISGLSGLFGRVSKNEASISENTGHITSLISRMTNVENNKVNVGSSIRGGDNSLIGTNNEGGFLQIISATKYKWEVDALNSSFRIIHYGSSENPLTLVPLTIADDGKVTGSYIKGNNVGTLYQTTISGSIKTTVSTLSGSLSLPAGAYIITARISMNSSGTPFMPNVIDFLTIKCTTGSNVDDTNIKSNNEIVALKVFTGTTTVTVTANTTSGTITVGTDNQFNRLWALRIC